MVKKSPTYKLSEHYRSIEKGSKAIVYNSLLGNAFLCDAATSDAIRRYYGEAAHAVSPSEKTAMENDSLIAKLRSGRLVVDASSPEPSQAFAAEEADIINSGRLVDTLRLVMTRNCNMACNYCYISKNQPDNPPRAMPWPIAKEALTSFFSLLRSHRRSKALIRFFGGEPMLNWQVVKRSLSLIEELSGKIKTIRLINTNGTIYSKRIADFLKDHQVGLAISVDGPPSVHDSQRKFTNGRGSFKAVMNNIEKYIRMDIPLGLETTLGDHNLDHLHELIDIVSLLNQKFRISIPLAFQEMCFNHDDDCAGDTSRISVDKTMQAMQYAVANNVAIENGLIHFPYKVLIGERDPGRFCRVAGKEISVEANGDIYPCAAMPVRLGNIADLKGVFKNPVYHRLVGRKAGNIIECKGCDIEGLCSGGCAADAYVSRNDFNRPAFGCDFRKKFFHQYSEYAILSNQA